MQEWYIDIDGSVSGPHPAAELARRMQDGRLGPAHRVSPDNATWLPFAAVRGLLAHLGNTAATVEFPTEPTAPTFPGYAIAGVLGRGGSGVVYRATQVKLGRPVALKTVPFRGSGAATQARRFAKEAEVLARLQHPNIVQVFDFHCDDQGGCLAMELLDGEDLDARITRSGPLDERTAWLIARQAAGALAYAATAGIIHRDVKSSNLFLVPAHGGYGLPPGVPLVKVTDFGLASTLQGDERITATGTLLGTPAYMAPEQVGDAQVDHRADIYGLGATLFHALSGRPPFADRTIWEILAEKTRGSPRLGPPTSEPSADLVAAMMAVDPARRIATYDELLARIDALPAMGSASAVRTAPRRNWRTLAAAGVLLVAAISAVWWVWPRAAVPVSVVATGAAEQLFDGKTLLPWTPSGGQPWAIEADQEGIPVLAGKGALRRRFRPHGPEFRVTLGLDLFEATACEITLEDAVLRITREKGAVAGRRDGERFEPYGDPVPFPSAEAMEGKAPYLEVQFVEAAGQRLVYFRGAKVAALLGGRPAREATLWIRAEGGRVRLDSAMHEEVRVER